MVGVFDRFYSGYEAIKYKGLHPTGEHATPSYDLKNQLESASSNTNTTPSQAAHALALTWEPQLQKNGWETLTTSSDVARAIWHIKLTAHNESPASPLKLFGLSDSEHSVGINDKNATVDQLIKYLVLKAYINAKKNPQFSLFTFSDFETKVHQFITEVQTQLTNIDNRMTLKSDAGENTLRYLKTFEETAARQQQEFNDAKLKLQTTIGYKTNGDSPNSGAIRSCEMQLSKIEPRQKKLQTLIPELEKSIADQAKKIPGLDPKLNINKDEFARALAALERNNPDEIAKIDATLHIPITNWNSQAHKIEGATQWKEDYLNQVEQYSARQAEIATLKQLENRLTFTVDELEKQRQQISNLQNPQLLDPLKTKANSLVNEANKLCGTTPTSYQKAENIIKSVTNDSGIVGLPIPGKDGELKELDKHLHEAVVNVNNLITQQKDLLDALKTDPSNAALQEEMKKQVARLKKAVEKLLGELNKYQDFSLTLQRLKDFEAFLRQVDALAKQSSDSFRKPKVLSPLKKEAFEHATKKDKIFSFSQQGKLEVHYNDQGKPLTISARAFDRAMAKFIANKGRVEVIKNDSLVNQLLRKFFNGPTEIYQFESASAKAGFLRVAMQESMLEEQQEEKDKDKNKPHTEPKLRVEEGNQLTEDEKEAEKAEEEKDKGLGL